MFTPKRAHVNIIEKDLLRESQYNIDELCAYVETNEIKLTDDQRQAYDYIMEKINSECGGIIFLDAPGGTGKTFLLNLTLAKIRLRNEIAIAVPSSGIAATLLDGGRTAHSTLKLPLNHNYNDTPTCNIGKKSGIKTIIIFNIIF